MFGQASAPFGGFGQPQKNVPAFGSQPTTSGSLVGASSTTQPTGFRGQPTFGGTKGGCDAPAPSGSGLFVTSVGSGGGFCTAGFVASSAPAPFGAASSGGGLFVASTGGAGFGTTSTFDAPTPVTGGLFGSTPQPANSLGGQQQQQPMATFGGTSASGAFSTSTTTGFGSTTAGGLLAPVFCAPATSAFGGGMSSSNLQIIPQGGHDVFERQLRALEEHTKELEKGITWRCSPLEQLVTRPTSTSSRSDFGATSQLSSISYIARHSATIRIHPRSNWPQLPSARRASSPISGFLTNRSNRVTQQHLRTSTLRLASTDVKPPSRLGRLKLEGQSLQSPTMKTTIETLEPSFSKEGMKVGFSDPMWTPLAVSLSPLSQQQPPSLYPSNLQIIPQSGHEILEQQLRPLEEHTKELAKGVAWRCSPLEQLVTRPTSTSSQLDFGATSQPSSMLYIPRHSSTISSRPRSNWLQLPSAKHASSPISGFVTNRSYLMTPEQHLRTSRLRLASSDVKPPSRLGRLKLDGPSLQSPTMKTNIETVEPPPTEEEQKVEFSDNLTPLALTTQQYPGSQSPLSQPALTTITTRK